jgi:hypothetical protein
VRQHHCEAVQAVAIWVTLAADAQRRRCEQLREGVAGIASLPSR